VYIKLELVRELQGKHVMLMGDFNYPDIVWSTHLSQSPHGQSFVDTVDDCFLTQHVNAAIHEVTLC